MIKLIPIPSKPDVELWLEAKQSEQVKALWTQQELRAQSHAINAIIDRMKGQP